jgi:hypothetical protein
MTPALTLWLAPKAAPRSAGSAAPRAARLRNGESAPAVWGLRPMGQGSIRGDHGCHDLPRPPARPGIRTRRGRRGLPSRRRTPRQPPGRARLPRIPAGGASGAQRRLVSGGGGRFRQHRRAGASQWRGGGLVATQGRALSRARGAALGGASRCRRRVCAMRTSLSGEPVDGHADHCPKHARREGRRRTP